MSPARLNIRVNGVYQYSVPPEFENFPSLDQRPAKVASHNPAVSALEVESCTAEGWRMFDKLDERKCLYRQKE
jgi:hypothetical protein